MGVHATPQENATEAQLRRELRQVGLTARAIDAAWPAWWSEEASTSPSATAELRFTLARRLGLSPQSLLEGQPTFLWRDEARYKSLTATPGEQAAIASFGLGLGRLLITAAPSPEISTTTAALDLRAAVLDGGAPTVDLNAVLGIAWSLGIPVVYATVLPTAQKRMHAMAVGIDDRYAVIVGRRYTHRSQAAFAISHELGHCLKGHLSSASAIVELGDPAKFDAEESDVEEREADHFALELLTGSSTVDVQSSTATFSASQLAQAARAQAPQVGIDAGVLALCLAHRTGEWRKAFGALKVIPPGREEVGERLNRLALSQLDLDALTTDSRDYVARILGAE